MYQKSKGKRKLRKTAAAAAAPAGLLTSCKVFHLIHQNEI
jgi:hypothetical protein